MEEIKEKLQKMQKQIDSAKIENAQAEGKIEEKLATIKEKFDVESVDELKEKLERFNTEKELNESVINNNWDELKTLWEEANE